MQKGFTLVELSIVLVIIGLLIGGVLVGESLISSARVNRLTSDIGQYEIAVVQFRERFRQYPGDSSYFSPAGNNDLIISNNSTEARNVWVHLSQAGMLSKNYEAYDSGIHGNYNSQSNADIVWPYNLVKSSKIQSWVSISGDKSPINVKKKYVTGNMSFAFHLDPTDSLALENKLGSQVTQGNVGNNEYKQVGLVNTAAAVGKCRGEAGFGSGGGNGRNSGGSGYDCVDGTNRGRLQYLIAP